MRVAVTAIEYYSSQSGKNLFGVIRLVGDGSRIKGLDKLFADAVNMELRTEPAVSMVRRTKHAAMEDVEGVDFTSALGAAIAPLGLQPKDVIAKASKKTTLKPAYGALAASVLIGGALVFAGFFRFNQAALEHNRLTARIAELSYIQKVYDENTAVKNEANQYKMFDYLTVTDNEQLGDLIAGLEQQLPSTTVIESLVTSGSQVTMNLVSPDEMTTAQLLWNLYEIPFITNASVPDMTKVEDEAGNVSWNYTVIVNYLPLAEEPVVETPAPAEGAAEGTDAEAGGETVNE